MVGPPWVPPVPRRRGRKPRVPVNQLLQALTFHVMQGAGTLAEHFFELFQEPLANSSWSDRRTRLPWEVFADLMRRALRPVATRRRQRDAFWRGWRLTALDGTQYSVTNTPQITATTTKAHSRRGRAAFAKISVNVLLELGLHNPLAAGIGRQGESEWALARQLLAHLPRRGLLLGDRLYGVPAFSVAQSPEHPRIQTRHQTFRPCAERCRGAVPDSPADERVHVAWRGVRDRVEA
jgi:hypothetical protein